MAEEDEDVELENSPLYLYLQEHAYEQQSSVNASASENGTTPSYWTKFSMFMKKIKQSLAAYVKSDLFMIKCGNLLENFLLDNREAILNSRALVEEDAEFLENIFADKISVQSSDSKLFSSAVFLKRLVLPLCLLLSYGIAKYQSTYFSFSSPFTAMTESMFIMTVSGSVILNVSLIALAMKKKSSYQNSLHCMQNFIDQSGNFLQCIKHCVCYLQELEVIGRGMLLTKPGTTINRLDQSLLFPRSPFPSGCLCIPLRLSLFRNVRQQLTAAKLATLQLINSFPLRAEFDNKSHYIAYISDEEFGPLLNADVSNDDEIILATNNLSVSALKSACQLYSVQLSELLRRLALTFYPPLFDRSSCKSAEGVLQTVPVILAPLSFAMQTACKSLKDSYLFHRLATQPIKPPEQKSSSKTPVFTSYGALAIAVQSLSLHLQVSLSRMNDFADELEKVSLNSEKLTLNEGFINQDTFETLNSQLELVNQDLQACKECWDESSLRLRKLCSEADCGEILRSEVVEPQLPPEVTITKISLLERTDIAPADQIFEAYADDANSPASEGDNFGDTENRKKTLEEKDISKRMLNELKVVLVSKSKEWREREAKVLAANGGMPCTALESDEKMDISREAESSHALAASHFSDAVSENTDDDGLEIDMVEGNSQHEQPFSMPSLALDSPFNIALMAAARSRMLNLSSCMKGETFKSVGEEYFSSSSSSDEDNENEYAPLNESKFR